MVRGPLSGSAFSKKGDGGRQYSFAAIALPERLEARSGCVDFN
jgi:hypothetical protein